LADGLLNRVHQGLLALFGFLYFIDKGATQSGSLGYDGRQQLFQMFNFTSKNVFKGEFELIWIIAANAALLD
jgi:hypothetical protein